MQPASRPAPPAAQPVSCLQTVGGAAECQRHYIAFVQAASPSSSETRSAPPGPGPVTPSGVRDRANVSELFRAVGLRVRARRTEQRLTLDELSARSGVSRRMITMLETGGTNASLGTLDKLARALRCDFSVLVSGRPVAPLSPAAASEVPALWTDIRGSSARLLVSLPGAGSTELWQWELAPGARYQAESDPPGSEELILVSSGRLVVEVGDQRCPLRAGGHLRLPTDEPYTYNNPGRSTARFIRVVMVPRRWNAPASPGAGRRDGCRSVPRSGGSHLKPTAADAGPLDLAAPTGWWRELLDLDAIRDAAERLGPVGVRTPLQRNDRLSERYAADVYLKREDLQAVRSYKIRGAYNFVAGLPGGSTPAGVVCASAGNHAQGVAWSCRRLGVRGTVFLPRRTPRQKIDRIRAIGAGMVDIRFAGVSFDDAADAAAEHAATTGATMVPAFDHPATVAGQGTVMLEVVEQLGSPPDVVLVPVGGGGLIAGTAACLDGMGAPTTIIGAQPSGCPAMVRSLEAGHPVTVEVEDDFVDGAVVRTPGRIAVAVTADLVDQIHLVPEGGVCTALLDLYQDDGIVAEPAGALSIAALDDVADEVAGKTVVCMLSGGNNDVARYGEIIERSLVHRGLAPPRTAS